MTLAAKGAKVTMLFDEIRVTEAGVSFYLRGTWMMMARPEPGQSIKINARGQIEGELK